MEQLAVLACFANSGIKEVTDVAPEYPASSPRIYGVVAIYFTLGIMKRYIEPTPKARQLFFLTLVMLGGYALLVSRIDMLLPPISSDAKIALDQAINRLFIGAVLSTLFFSGFVFAAIHTTRRAVKSGQWPPVGMPVPFRTQVTEIVRPWKAWAILAAVLIYLTFKIAMPWFIYLEFQKMESKLQELESCDRCPTPRSSGTAQKRAAP